MKKLLLILLTFISVSALAQTATLTGTGTDTDGSIVGYSWRKISGPSGSIIANSSFASTIVSGLQAGIYQFELTVTDNQGATGADTVQITVLAGNVKPKANAGPDQIITLPSTGANLNQAEDMAAKKP